MAASELSSLMSALRGELTRDLDVRLDGPVEQQVQQVLGELDVDDPSSIIFFGARAQQQLTSISDGMLEHVRAKDVGPAGGALARMVGKLRELNVTALDPTARPGLIGRLLGAKSDVQQFVDRYDDVRSQIDSITVELEQHKTRMLTDIVRLEKLYEANLDYFRTLEVYIAAGRLKLKELDERTVPALAREAAGSDDILQAQRLRDLRAARDDLERRVHDLLLTRQVTMQALPSLRLVQENDKSLVTKISSTLANTVPLWRQQLAQAITIFRMGDAARAVKAASDLTNELLTANAEDLQRANTQVRTEVERGVFDLAAVKHANERLIATIDESLRIADDGKRRRAAAEGQLRALEGELRATLASASARVGGEARTPPGGR